MSCIIRFSVITKREEMEFAKLFRSPEMQEFLEWDRYFEIADNYLISTALIYMLRAQYVPKQFTFFNFMVALYLAHEVEEEDSELRLDLIRAAFGSQVVSQQSFRLFMKKKEKLWIATRYNVIVKREESDSVMNRILNDHYIWRRNRLLRRTGMSFGGKRGNMFATHVATLPTIAHSAATSNGTFFS